MHIDMPRGGINSMPHPSGMHFSFSVCARSSTSQITRFAFHRASTGRNRGPVRGAFAFQRGGSREVMPSHQKSSLTLLTVDHVVGYCAR